MPIKNKKVMLDNSIPPKLQTKLRNIRFLSLLSVYVPTIILYIVSPPSTTTGHLIVFSITTPIAISCIIISLRANAWHFSKIRFTPDGVYLYRDTVKYLPKERFIPWEKIIGFNTGKNAAILTINYNPYYLYCEAREMTPYYFMLYGVKKNPKIKKFIDEKYPFIYEKYRFELQEENKSKKVKIEGGDV